MKKHLIISLALVSLVFLFFANISHAVLAGRVTFAEGRVDVLKPGKNMTAPVKTGDTVDVDDIYRAKSDGRVEITFINGNILKIAPNTRAEIKEAMVNEQGSSHVVKLHRGRVQAISSEEFVKKVSAFAEKNRFEVHTPNAVAGIRGSNMIVSFLRNITSTLFTIGRGYQFNPGDPQRRIVNIVGGTISFVTTATGSPSPPRPATSSEIAVQVSAVTTVEKPKEGGKPGQSSQAGGQTSAGTSQSSGGSSGSSSGSTGTASTGSDSGGSSGSSASSGQSSSSTTSASSGSTSGSQSSSPGTGTSGSVWISQSGSSGTNTSLNPVTGSSFTGTVVSSTISSNNANTPIVTTTATGPTVSYVPPPVIVQDTIPPILTVISKPDAVSGSDNARFQVSADKTSTFEYAVDGAAWILLNGTGTNKSFNIHNLSDGNHSIYIRAISTEGYASSTSSYSWFVDATDPVVTIVSKPDTRTAQSSANFTFSANETVTYQYRLDGGSWITTGSSLNLSGLSEGNHRIEVRATDTIGNISPTVRYTWRTIYTEPVINIASSPPSATNQSSAAFTFSANKTVTYQYRLDGGSWITTGSSLNLSGLSEGSHTIYIRATDSSGNTSSTVSYAWQTDYTAPLITSYTSSSTPGSGGTANITVATSTGESTNTAYSIDGGTYTTVSGTSFTANIPAGSHSLSFKSIDGAGNESALSTISFSLNSYSLSGTMTGTGSSMSGTISNSNTAEVLDRGWGSWNVSIAGAYSGSPSSSWQSKSGGAMNTNTGWWLLKGTGAYSGNTMTGTSNLSYITRTTLGSGTGTISGSHDSSTFSLTDSGSNLTGTSLKSISDVSASKYYLTYTGTLTAGTPVTISSPQSIAVDPTGKFAYAAYDDGVSCKVKAYTISRTTGALTEVEGTPTVTTASMPVSVAVDPTGRFVYVANSNGSSSTVSAYTINRTTGTLTEVAGTPTTPTGNTPNYVAVDPTGKFVYVVNNGSNSVSAYIINQTTGALITVEGASTGTNPTSIAIDPTGKFAYVTNFNSNSVSVYAINQSTGVLTEKTGTGFPVSIGAGTNPNSIAVDPTGKFAYVTDYNFSTVSVYAIDQSTGALTQVGTAVSTGTSPKSVAVDPTGKFVYVTNFNSNKISVYAINQSTGALTAAAEITTGSNQPCLIVIDPNGKFAYVTNTDNNSVSVYSIDAATRVSDGTINAYMGSTASLWTATQAAPAPVSMIGSYSSTSSSRHTWMTNLSSYNFVDTTPTTYDGGSYKGYLGGIDISNVFEGIFAALYIDPSGNAGYLKGSLSGTGYPNISMFEMAGNAYPTQMTSGIGISPADLGTMVYEGTGSISLSGTIGTGGTLNDKAGTDRYFKTLSIVKDSTAQPWGVYSFLTYGTFRTPTSGTTWTATLGGSSTAFGKYFDGTTTQPDTGYWLVSSGSGTWTNNRIGGTLSGNYITKTSLGTITGDVLGTYDTAWQMASVGAYTGTALKSVSEVSVNRYFLSNSGTLTAGTAIAAGGTKPLSITADPTGRFAYVVSQISNDISVFSINQSTGALTQVGSPIATGTYPRSVTVDPTGRFAYVANYDSNNVFVYTINSSTGALTQVGSPIAGTNPVSVTVDPTGRFAYVANWGSNNVSVYTINSSTGALTQVGSPIAAETNPRYVTVDPAGKFVYVSNGNSHTVSVYTINSSTGALTQVGSPIATGTYPYSVTVDPTGKFAYVANGGSDSVSVYTIKQSDGTLTFVETIAAGTNPQSVTVDPTGKFAYVANTGSDTVSVYMINQTTGALTQVESPIAAGTGPNSIVVDPTGRFLYVSNYTSNNISVFSIDAAIRTADGTMTAYMGSASSLWTATQASPASVTMIGTYNGAVNAPRTWMTSISSHNYIDSASTSTTYDGGSYRGYIGGIHIDNALEARLAALYIDPSGNAGYLKGSLSGTGYPDIGMFQMTGSSYPNQMVSALGITPENLAVRTYEGTGYISLSGTIGTNGTLNDRAGVDKYFKTLSIFYYPTAQPWGIYSFFTYGGFITPASGTTWTGNMGGSNTAFGKYLAPGDIPSLQPDTGYWLAGIGSGTWTNSRIGGTLSGDYITKTRLGTITGDILGTYGSAWQMASVGSWQGSSLNYVSDIDAFRHNLGFTGGLTAGTTVPSTGVEVNRVAVDPTGRFVYLSNNASYDVSVYKINQNTGVLETKAEAATGACPTPIVIDPIGKILYVSAANTGKIYAYDINQTEGTLGSFKWSTADTDSGHVDMAMDPTGRFIYGLMVNTGKVYTYTINQADSSLAKTSEIDAGTEPYSVKVHPSGKFLYVANRGSTIPTAVFAYDIDQSTGALTNKREVVAGGGAYFITIDPTGRFAYVMGGNNIYVYIINQSTGALSGASLVASGNSVAVDPTGRFAYVTNAITNKVTVYTINQSNGALTGGMELPIGGQPKSVAVDPTGRFVYVANNNDAISVYSIDTVTRTSDGTLTAYIGGTTSLFNGCTTPVTMIGTYDLTGISAFLWGQTVTSYNYITNQNTTYDTSPNAYAGFITGYKAEDNSMKGKWASVYVKNDGSAGIHLGTLTGTAYPGIRMLEMTGTINTPVEMVSSSGMGSITPLNLYPTNTSVSSNYNGTPIYTSFSGGEGSITPEYYKYERLNITGQDWGVWKSVNSGTYAGTISSDWILSADYQYLSWTNVIGSETTGTRWADTDKTLWAEKKLSGETVVSYGVVGYGADFSTGKTWVSTGETIGTFNPTATTYQSVSAGALIETGKFIWMAENEQSKLQALNIPCVQVGMATLSQSAANDYISSLAMNSVKFFSTSSGAKPQIWATNNVSGSYSGNPAGTTVGLSGGGLTADFNIKRWNDSKWLATVTNGTGSLTSGGIPTTYTNTIQFRGAGAGSYTGTTTGTLSGTAAGVVKR